MVTGGTRGLGLAIAARLTADGFRVIAVARTPGEVFAKAQAVSPAAALHFHECDLSDLDAVTGLVQRVGKQFGPLYGLVNNAGLGTSGILATMPDRQMDALLRLNVASPMKLTRQALRSMMVGGAGGRIVNIASIVASTGFSGLSVYAATKSAMIGFTRSLAREVGSIGITVNAVAPGFVMTDMTQDLSGPDRDRVARRAALRRLAEAVDVANAVSYLCADAARNVTGTVLTVDAGATA